MPTTTTDIHELTNDQSNALDAIFDWLKNRERSGKRYLIVSGYAGTGKTTLLAYFRRELFHQDQWKDQNIAFCCYTGKAASVLRQKLTDTKALYPNDTCGTIHSLIYKAITDDDGRIIRWEREPKLTCDLIIVDEGSMINSLIWSDLLSYNIPVLVCGDHGQLPPIDGSFDLMRQADVTIEQIVRQAADNPIIQLSARIRKGGGIPYGSFGGGLVQKISLQDPDAEEIFANSVFQSADSYLCVCGRNRTRIGLNQRMRALFGYEEQSPIRGERVICLKNNHIAGIYNGMIGRLIKIDESDDHWYQISVNFEDQQTPFEGLALKYQFGQEKTLKEPLPKNIPVSETQFENLFDFGYALTVHKAQGSEARSVVLFEERMFNSDDEQWKRWLYTAVTRAQEKLIVFG